MVVSGWIDPASYEGWSFGGVVWVCIFVAISTVIVNGILNIVIIFSIIIDINIVIVVVIGIAMGGVDVGVEAGVLHVQVHVQSVRYRRGWQWWSRRHFLSGTTSDLLGDGYGDGRCIYGVFGCLFRVEDGEDVVWGYFRGREVILVLVS